MASRQSPVKLGGWQIFLSTVQVFSFSMVTGDGDRKKLIEGFGESGSVGLLHAVPKFSWTFGFPPTL